MGGVDRKQPSRRVAVMLPYPFPGPFDYRVPPELTVRPGDVVLVPLNRREVVGVVWDGAPPGESDFRAGGAGDGGVPDRKLKPLIAVLDTPPMRAVLRRFVDWLASYTLSPPGEVMAMALRVVSPDTGRAPSGWRPADPLPESRPTPARQRVLAVLEDGLSRSAAELARAAGIGAGVVRAMAQGGLLVPAVLPPHPPFTPPDPDHPGPPLSAAQAAAAAVLRAA